MDGRVRLLHNIMGLWVLSEAVRTWERSGHPLDLPTLLASAEEVTEQVPVFDANDPRFLPPGDMPARIEAWCEDHGTPHRVRAPNTPGASSNRSRRRSRMPRTRPGASAA